MIYQSPIEMFTTEIISKIEDGAVKAVQAVGFNVDKEELEKALIADRHRYEMAYQRGYEARDNDIIRCKDCMHYKQYDFEDRPLCREWAMHFPAYGFCYKAERRSE